MFNSKLC